MTGLLHYCGLRCMIAAMFFGKRLQAKYVVLSDCLNRQKNILLTKTGKKDCFLLVPLAGVEPARPQRRLILSQVRLPIPPQRHVDTEQNYIIIAVCVCQQIS